MAFEQNSEIHFTPGAAVLAWIWPGAGHISLGQTRRGLIIMAGVLFLFLGGMLIGGIDVVDRKDDRLWFIAQFFCGPIALGSDYINQNVIKNLDDEQRITTTSIGRVNEIGTLFCALAGLMNLVVILDALHNHPKGLPIIHDDNRRQEDGP